VRQRLRGYADALVEGAGTEELERTAGEMSAVLRLIDASQDLRYVLTDPGVPVATRRAVVTDLLQSRVEPLTLRLVSFILTADRAGEFRDDVAWLTARVDAASRHLEPVSDVVLGHRAAEERVEGYATGLLESVGDRRVLERVEDELFRFSRTVASSDELMVALSSRDLPALTRQALVVDLLRGRATPETVRLAAYATRVGRPRDYEALVNHLVDWVAAENNRRLADVRVPVDLDEDRRRHLAEALSQVTGHPVDIRVTLDPSVLGGFVATIGETVVDGSTRHRLELLKQRLATPEAEATTGGRN
jgi:F-type H+-transporting ATPase subunit delta